MNAAAALIRLQNATQSSVEPALSSDELTDLLALAAIVDAVGKTPADAGWTPTYSPNALNGAAAEGWRWKAGKLGDGETFSGDGASFNPEVRRTFCMDQAEVYRKRIVGTMPLTGRTSQRFGLGTAVGDEWQL
jgi:hypothetical protein